HRCPLLATGKLPQHCAVLENPVAEFPRGHASETFSSSTSRASPRTVIIRAFRCRGVDQHDHQSGAAPRTHAGRRDAVVEIEVGYRPPDSVRSRLGAFSDRSIAVVKSVKTVFLDTRERRL